MPTLLQYLGFLGGQTADGQKCQTDKATDSCFVFVGQAAIPVSSMILYVQAIAFFLQFLLMPLGSLGDYDRYSYKLLAVFTAMGCIGQISPVLLINDNGKYWYVMALLMIMAIIGYCCTLIFYAAAYPNISDHLPAVKRIASNLSSTFDQIQLAKEQSRKKVSTMTVMCASAGFLMVSILLSGIARIPWSHGPFLTGGYTFGDTPMYNYIGTAFCGGLWLILAIPYFVFSPKGRRGPPFPTDENCWKFGWNNLVLAFRDVRHYRQLFKFILANFLFGDAVTTIDQMMSIVQGELSHFSTENTVLMGIMYGVASICGCLFFLWLSRRYRWTSKTSLLVHLSATALIPLWGSMGIWSTKIGFRTTPELWLFSLWAGFFTSPLW
ncbi:hypothetical protein DM01DRAFT_1374468 [Hesseltinella vesiculosa]|uniref:Autophagy-related protein n=1 Tax=Hesseltinella vesiculosa TaxID=101127 RepID=A0A1X2GHF3_9FUNG|nr:hypothetical protein DM01DRAFT_1374468 [Hesseltinella vesiculosa]